MSAVRVSQLGRGDAPRLRVFLDQRADVSVFHRPEWHDVIRETWGHSCEYWAAWSGDAITGVFPVVAVHAPLFGTKLVAMAYQMGSGYPIAADTASERAMVEAAASQARQRGVRYLEIRHFGDAPLLDSLGFESVDAQLVTTVVSLRGLALSAVRRNHRRNVRDARDRGVVIGRSHSIDDLRTFWRLYLDEGRRVGAPQAGWNYFENLHRLAPDCYRLHCAWRLGRVVAGLVSLTDGRTVFARHAAYGSPEALAVHAGAALYWHAMQEFAADGCETFNCGISWSGDNGLIHWKEGWNGATVPVRIHVLPVRHSAPIPGEYFGRYQVVKSIWRRLPLPVVDFAGRHVTRWVA